MANYVYSLVQITGKDADIAKMLSEMKTQDDDFDFSTVVPIPQDLLQAGVGSYGRNATAYLRLANPHNTNISDPSIPKLPAAVFDVDAPRLAAACWTCIDPAMDNDPTHAYHIKDAQQGKLVYDAWKKYGYASDYEFRCHEWGTKSNAWDCVIDDSAPGACTITFNTAWSPPGPFMDAFAAKYPDLDITYEYAEECAGSFAGRAEYSAGSQTACEYYQNAEKELYELYFKVTGYDPDECGLRYDPIYRTYIYIGENGEDEFSYGALPSINECAVMVRRDNKPPVPVMMPVKADPEKERRMMLWLMMR